MPAIECVFEVVVDENVCVCLGQDGLKRLDLCEEAFGVGRRVFPVQSQFDGGLGELADDADEA